MTGDWHVRVRYLTPGGREANWAALVEATTSQEATRKGLARARKVRRIGVCDILAYPPPQTKG